MDKKKDLQLAKIAYDIYERDYYKDHDDNMTPVCFDEFYNNEWQEPLIKLDYIIQAQKEDISNDPYDSEEETIGYISALEWVQIILTNLLESDYE